jgi:ketosteroid isomerase-like protein
MAFFIPTTSVKANCAIAVVIWKKQTDGKWTLSNSSYIQIK